MTPPRAMRCDTDGNELFLIRTLTKTKVIKETTYVYGYTKSLTKKGMELPLYESSLNDLLRKEIFKAIS